MNLESTSGREGQGSGSKEEKRMETADQKTIVNYHACGRMENYHQFPWRIQLNTLKVTDWW